MKTAIRVPLQFGLLATAWLLFLHHNAASGQEAFEHPETKPRNLLADKGVQGLAHRLGATILRLRDQEFQEALEPIQLTAGLRKAMEASEDMRSIKAAASPAEAIQCVGFRMISTEAATFVYVLVNEQGPWGIKYGVHIHQGKFYVSTFSATSSWDGIEKMYQTVDPLESKLVISRKDTNGPQPGLASGEETDRLGSNLEARLQAALGISYAASRNEALQAVASTAAAAGRGDLVKRAVAAIDNSGTRDKVAADCALKLAEAGQSKAAGEVANQIVYQAKRDQTLKRIAESP